MCKTKDPAGEGEISQPADTGETSQIKPASDFSHGTWFISYVKLNTQSSCDVSLNTQSSCDLFVNTPPLSPAMYFVSPNNKQSILTITKPLEYSQKQLVEVISKSQLLAKLRGFRLTTNIPTNYTFVFNLLNLYDYLKEITF